MTTLTPVFHAPSRPESPEGAEMWEYLVVPLQEAKGLRKAGDPYSPGESQRARRTGLGSSRSVARVRRPDRLAGRSAQATAGLRSKEVFGDVDDFAPTRQGY